jgi:hypothetical protein
MRISLTLHVCIRAAAHRLKWRECTVVLRMVRLILWLWLWLRLQTLLQLSDGRTIEGGRWKNAGLQGTTVETWTIAVETLANDLTAANDDRAVAIVKGRELGLSEAKGEEGIVARRHFDV